MRYQAVRRTLQRIAGRTDIDKPINPHHFRHSRATYLASKFTEAQMCEYFGWVQGSDVPAKYVHMSGRDIDPDYERLHGIEGEEEEKKAKQSPEECPRCGSMVAPEASFCQNCGQALSQEAFERIEEEEKNFRSFERDGERGRGREDRGGGEEASRRGRILKTRPGLRTKN